MAIAFAALTLPLRIIQAVFAIIVLGLMAYVVNDWSGGYYSYSPSSANFLLFVSIWTLLALLYLVLTPGRYPTIAHKFGLLFADALTMLFWFAGFIALAAMLGDIGCGRHWGVCRASEAAVVFAALEWLLFGATTVAQGLHCWRTRRERGGRGDPAMEVHTGRMHGGTV